MKRIWILTLLLSAYMSPFAQFDQTIVNQNSWRWRNNNGSETSAMWKAAQNTRINYNVVNGVVRLRIELVNASYYRRCPIDNVCYNDPVTKSMRDSLQFSTTPTDPLSWKNIGLDARLPFVMANAATYVKQGDTTTSQLAGSSYTFSTGRVIVSDSVIKNISIPGYRRSEFEWAIVGTRNLVPNTTYYFRQRGRYNYAEVYPTLFDYPSSYTQYPTAYPALTTGTLPIYQPPTVSITSAVNNAVYYAPATINIAAAASDADGTIRSVEFYNGTALLKSVGTPPYSFAWTNVAAGTYYLKAKATDNDGLSTTSSIIKISVLPNKAPVVSITSPVNNAVYTAGATINVNASASDADGTIKSVKFYSGTSLVKTDSISPYAYSKTTSSTETYYLKAIATDNQGLSTTSSIIKISVLANKAPTVRITSPVNNAVYSAGATINISAAAFDGDSTIKNVKFYRGTTLIKTDITPPYSFSWTNASAGMYSLKAIATDNFGLSATSAIVNVSVVAPTTIASSMRSSKIDQIDADGPLSLKLSPNPATGILQVSTTGMQQNKPVTISVMSSSGVVMKTIRLNASNKVVQLDVSSLVSGEYIIKVVSGDRIMHEQFVKL